MVMELALVVRQRQGIEQRESTPYVRQRRTGAERPEAQGVAFVGQPGARLDADQPRMARIDERLTQHGERQLPDPRRRDAQTSPRIADLRQAVAKDDVPPGGRDDGGHNASSDPAVHRPLRHTGHSL